jgi:hypothetical protein
MRVTIRSGIIGACEEAASAHRRGHLGRRRDHRRLAPIWRPPARCARRFSARNPVQARTDPKTGEITGPIADLTRELARRLNVPSS